MIEIEKQTTSPDLETNGPYYLSSLLPYDPIVKTGARLLDGLKEYSLLLTAAKQAAESLLYDQLECFDPLVGENACQIRALALAMILRNASFDLPRLLTDINHAQLALKELIESPSEVMKIWPHLFDAIQRNNLEVLLNESEIFLIKSYLLSAVKTPRLFKPELPLVKNEYTDTKKIKKMGDVGTMFSENLVRSLREKLSSSSVKFVQKIAAQLPSLDLSTEMVSDKFLILYRGLQCLPCYWMTKVLMHEAQNQNIPLVIMVEQVAKDRNYEVMQKMTLIFQPTPGGYQVASLTSFHPDTPALVFLGRSCRDFKELPEQNQWKKELLEYSPIDLVLAYAATHRQYPDSAKEHLVFEVQDEAYAYHQAKSHEWGCSIENPSLFFLAHAYCEKIKNIQ